MAKRKERISYRDKVKNNKEWFREYIDTISLNTISREDRLRMKVNYDLFNNKIQQSDFDYVCKPYGDQVKALPVSMQNRDIVSGKIKTLMGMEMQRPFTYKVFSTNAEATTEREKKEFEMIREFVVESIMAPIKEQINLQMQQQMSSVPPEQMEQFLQQAEQKMLEMEQQMTPEEIKKYMQREYQDPAEVLSSQLLEYFRHKLDLKNKFSQMFKNALLTSRGIVYVGIVSNEPEVFVVNPMRFNFARSPESEYIEDSEWAMCEYKMNPSQIVKYFSKELKDEEVDRIYKEVGDFNIVGGPNEDLFYIIDNETDDDQGINVYHCTWKALRKIGFLTYIDEYGQEQSQIVDEHYKLEPDLGDIKIEWEWIPEVYEGWKINTTDPIYVNMRAIPGQFKDLDNLYDCKLPYYGSVYDSYNSNETSLMDRIKYYQYLYNIVMYRLELLMASDKGKKLMMNINSIPDSMQIDFNKWQYFAETSPYLWFNPAEEGMHTQSDANTVAKVMDLSLVSDIKKYIEIAEYIKQQCGKSVGITEQVEGQIGQYEAVRNTNQALIQSSYILEYYFETHDRCKVNIIKALLETAKVCYSLEKPKKLSYVLDDMSMHTLTVEPGILDNSTLGIFVSSSSKTEKTKDLIQQLSQAALQTQTVDFSDIISIMNAESVPEAEEILKTAQERRANALQEQQRQQQEHEQNMLAQQNELQKIKFEQEKELIVLKEEERRKTEIAKMAIMGASYNPDHDADNDGMNDFIELSKLELAKFTAEEDLKMKKEEASYARDMKNAENNRQDRLVKAQIHKMSKVK